MKHKYVHTLGLAALMLGLALNGCKSQAEAFAYTAGPTAVQIGEEMDTYVSRDTDAENAARVQSRLDAFESAVLVGDRVAVAKAWFSMPDGVRVSYMSYLRADPDLAGGAGGIVFGILTRNVELMDYIITLGNVPTTE